MFKVALIGNMNNNFFSIARYLRDEGIDADLIVVGEENAHFPPDADSYITDNPFIKHEMWFKKGLFTEKKGYQLEVKNRLSDYDFIIGCGYAPFFCQRYRIGLDIFVPYGDDIYRIPLFCSKFNILFSVLNILDRMWRYITGNDFVMRSLRKINFPNFYLNYRQYKLAWHQSEGIKGTDKIVMLAGDPVFDKVFKTLGIEDKIHRVPVPMVYHKQYVIETLETHRKKLPYIESLEKFRESHDIVIIYHARHIWLSFVDEFSSKGNDVLFRGIAEYLQQGGSRKVGVITLEYGPDVDASKDLIDSLGLTQHVLWLPLSPRKDIMSIMPLADLGANCFSHSWLTGGVLYECIVSGLPVLQKRESFIPNVFPVLESNSVSDVADWLFRWDTDRDEIKRRAEAAKSWYINDVAGKAVQFYSQAINDALQHRDLDSA